MEDIIFGMMKEGYNCEQIDKVYEAALLAADSRYGEWKREQERKARAEEERKLRLEYEQKKRDEAREALGAAVLNYMEALGFTIEEGTYNDIDAIVDALPQIKVVRYWR